MSSNRFGEIVPNVCTFCFVNIDDLDGANNSLMPLFGESDTKRRIEVLQFFNEVADCHCLPFERIPDQPFRA